MRCFYYSKKILINYSSCAKQCIMNNTDVILKPYTTWNILKLVLKSGWVNAMTVNRYTVNTKSFTDKYCRRWCIWGLCAHHSLYYTSWTFFFKALQNVVRGDEISLNRNNNCDIDLPCPLKVKWSSDPPPKPTQSNQRHGRISLIYNAEISTL